MIESKRLKNIPHVLHGFGVRAAPIPHEQESLWSNKKPLWQQVHGVQGIEIDQENQSCGEVDALWTQKANLPIAVVTADCVPVLFAHHTGQTVACAHAGWRGIKQGVHRELWSRLRKIDSEPSHWTAAIGPSIGPCCYEVSEELTEDFTRSFSHIPADQITPEFRKLNLPRIVEMELVHIGLTEIDVLPYCTRCSTLADGSPRFFSYRRDGKGVRQYSLIMQKGEER